MLIFLPKCPNGIYWFLIMIQAFSSVHAKTVTGTKIRGEHKPYMVVDKVRPVKLTDQHGVIVLNSFTSPDWSDVSLDGRVRYLEALLLIDAEVTRFYLHDATKFRPAVMRLIEGVNMFLQQLDIRILIVDIRPMPGNNVSLEQFMEYRNSEIANLPAHDFAMLLRFRYEGGIAYVNGLCGRAGVGLSGFAPEAPMEYASVFFHELAHLLGMPHDATAECYCSKKNSDGSCLKIDGYDNDCSVQALANRLRNHQCVNNLPTVLPETTVPLCGNGIVEPGEECDCGLERYCLSLICIPQTCTQRISNFWLNITLFAIATISILLAFCACKRLLCHRKQKTIQRKQFDRRDSPLQSKNTWSTLPTLPQPQPALTLQQAQLNTTLTSVLSSTGTGTLPVRIAPPPPRPRKPMAQLAQSTEQLANAPAYTNSAFNQSGSSLHGPMVMTLDRNVSRPNWIPMAGGADYMQMNPVPMTGRNLRSNTMEEERPHTYQDIADEDKANTDTLSQSSSPSRRPEISAPIPFIVTSKKVNPIDFINTSPSSTIIPPPPPPKALITIDDVIPLDKRNAPIEPVVPVKEKLKQLGQSNASSPMNHRRPTPNTPIVSPPLKPKRIRPPPPPVDEDDEDPIYDLPPDDRDYEKPKTVKNLAKNFGQRN